MSDVKVFTPVISKELQDFIMKNPKIEKVWFDAKNRHYFNVFKLRKDNKDQSESKDWLEYGRGLFSHQEVIPGVFNVDKKKETIAKGNPDTLIVTLSNENTFMTRDEILKATPNVAGDSIVSKFMNMTPAERAMLRELLMGTESEEEKAI